MVQLAVRHEHPARRTCRMLALDMFALLPVLAPVLSKSGSVRANPENAERLLRKGELLGVFPEGVKGVGKYYRDRYRLARFGRGGFVRIALRTRAPMIPCAVVGAEEIHPCGRRPTGWGSRSACRTSPDPDVPVARAARVVPVCRRSGRSTSASRSTSRPTGPRPPTTRSSSTASPRRCGPRSRR